MPSKLRPIRILLRLSCVLAFAACGAGEGTSSHLPPGPATTAPPGDIVLYVTMAQGNRVDAYRLGTDGLLPAAPSSTMHVLNPRRLALADGVLHVSTIDRIVSARLGANGELPVGPDAETAPAEGSLPLELVARNGVLYAAVPGSGTVTSYVLEDGLVPIAPTGIGKPESSEDYVSLELNGNYLYAGTRSSHEIHVYLLEQDGNVPPTPEDQQPMDGISLPDDIVIRDNILYVTSAGDRAIHEYKIREDGTLPADQNSRTEPEDFYSSILLSGDTMYVTAYNLGRVDLFQVLANGTLPEEPAFAHTHADPAAYPAKMALERGILYVAQAGLDRIDAYVMGADGMPPEYPSSSTVPAPGKSFPTDLVTLRLNVE